MGRIPSKKRVYKKRTPFSFRKKVPQKKYIARICKKVISRTAETKLNSYRQAVSLMSPPSIIWQGDNTIALTPYTGTRSIQIGQGTAFNQRLGNKITTKSLILSFQIFPLIYNATTNPTPKPLNIYIWIYKKKSEPTLLNDDTSDFFKWQAGTEGIAGEMSDFTKVINKENYIVYKKLMFKVGTGDVSGTGAVPGAQYYTNNDYKYNVMRKINLTKYCPKLISFQDNSSAPMTPLLQMTMEVVTADGYPLPNTYIPAQLRYQLDYYYQDM
jgi:hypothetical protein